MKIVLDASCLARAQPTGIATYARNLIHHLAAIDSENIYYLGYLLSRLKKRRHFIRVPQPNFKTKIFHDSLSMGFPRGIDIFHGLDVRIAFWEHPQKIATIHDIGAILYPEFSAPSHREKMLGRYERVLRACDWVVTDSHHTRADIQDRFSVPESKTRVIHLGVEERFFPRDMDRCSEVLQAYGINRPYFLFLGSISFRKNVTRMIEAFFAACPKIPSSMQFVLAGEEGYGSEDILSQLSRAPLRDRVRWIGYIPQEDLPFFYSHAAAFLFVTLYEGFGLPVPEAMACGTPVIASNVSSVPEVASDAATLVDPYDTSQIRDAIIRIAEDPVYRSGMREKGLKRARLFSWEGAARETLGLYRQVFSGKTV